MDARRATVPDKEVVKVLGVPGNIFELFASMFLCIRSSVSTNYLITGCVVSDFFFFYLFYYFTAGQFCF